MLPSGLHVLAWMIIWGLLMRWFESMFPESPIAKAMMFIH